jgi:carbamoylphosphate synthase large subunit
VSSEQTTIVLTGVGLDGGPDVIRALRADPALDAFIVGVDASPDHAGRQLCDAFHLVPLRDDPGYVDAVRKVARDESARVIYPLPTFDQPLFAEAAERLRAGGLAVAVSPPEAVGICNDKWTLYERLREKRPEIVPRTERVESAEALESAARELGYPERRVCIRRRVSRGAMGLRVLDQGPARTEALLHESPGSLLVSLTEVLDVLGQTSSFPEYLVQEYLAAPEWDVDVLCRNGTALIVSTRRNLAMTGAGTARAVLEPEKELRALSEELVAGLGLNAVVNVAFRRDEGGAAKLLEINPRIPSSVLSTLAGGHNLVALAVRQELGETIEPAEPEWGGSFTRHFSSVVTDRNDATVI